MVCRQPLPRPAVAAHRLAAAARVTALSCCLSLCSIASAPAQFSTGPLELSGAVSLDEAGSDVRAHLERIKAYVAEGQADEAVDALQKIMETHGSKMIALARGRYVNLTDYCHVQIASLPDEALTLYRQRVDGVAKTWYDDGVANHDSQRLRELVDKMLCSTWGDDALWALGEMELERGRPAAARRYWERLIEVPPARIVASDFEAARGRADLTAEDAALLDHWYVADVAKAAKTYELRADEIMPDDAATALVRLWKRERHPASRVAYPGSQVPRAEVRARLILASIMEGSLERARDELKAFVRLHPDAQGRLGGRQVKLADAIGAMIESVPGWAAPRPSDQWPTFAGAAARTKISPRRLDLGAQAWEPISLGDPIAADSSNSRVYSMRRIGEDAQRLLSYHPIVVDHLLLFNNQAQIFAFDTRTGKPAWPSEGKPSGEIYEDEQAQNASSRMHHGLGVPRFTMTAHRGKLYARMGSPVTSRPLESMDGRNSGYIVCLDLASEGRMLWKIPRGDEAGAFDEKWAFEGSPLVDESGVYVAMRKSDVRPQAHVACFDPETGRLKWRTMICAAETAGGGQLEEITHNLLTLGEGMLYYNTNLGVVAALSTHSGRLHCATSYPRAKKATPDGQDRRTAHFYRDLNPCVYYRGLLLAAPADSESIFALDAGGGEMIWESHLAEDAVHLLGVGHGNLLASGDSLWWIDARGGKVLKRWPDTTPLGRGRGILVGDQVAWPTQDQLWVLDQDVAPKRDTPREPIALAEAYGATGGNLLAGDGLLFIATPEKLFAFRQLGPETSDDPNVASGGKAGLAPETARGALSAGTIKDVAAGARR